MRIKPGIGVFIGIFLKILFKKKVVILRFDLNK